MKTLLNLAYLLVMTFTPVYGSQKLRVIQNSENGAIEEKLIFEYGINVITIDTRIEKSKPDLLSGMDLAMRLILTQKSENQCVALYRKNNGIYLSSLLFENDAWKIVFSERIFIKSSNSLKIIKTINEEIRLTGSEDGEIIIDSKTGLPKLMLGGKERAFPAIEIEYPIESVVTGGLRRAGDKHEKPGVIDASKVFDPEILQEISEALKASSEKSRDE